MLSFSAIMLVSIAGALLLMQALNTLETASRDYESASGLLTDLSRAEAFHLDRSNLSRLYVLARREDAVKRYQDASQNFDKMINAAKSVAIDDKKVETAIEHFQAAANTWREKIGDPVMDLSLIHI